jgi:hypothetical protein
LQLILLRKLHVGAFRYHAFDEVEGGMSLAHVDVLQLREWCILRKTSSHLCAMSELRRHLRRHVVSAMTKMTSSMAVTTTTTAPRVKEATATMVRMRQNAVKTSPQLSLPLIGDKWPVKVLLTCPIFPSTSAVRVVRISALKCLPFQGKNSAEAAFAPMSTPR